MSIRITVIFIYPTLPTVQTITYNKDHKRIEIEYLHFTENSS